MTRVITQYHIGARALPGLVACMSVSSCGEQTSVPMVGIDLSPTLLCEGETPQVVTASGRRSTDPAVAAEELVFAWKTEPSPTEILRGSTTDAEWVGRFSARSPLWVELTVTTATGESATRSRILPLTRTNAVPCSQGCLDHEICANTAGREVCVEAATCNGDDECSCLHCVAADDSTRHCTAE